MSTGAPRQRRPRPKGHRRAAPEIHIAVYCHVAADTDGEALCSAVDGVVEQITGHHDRRRKRSFRWRVWADAGEAQEGVKRALRAHFTHGRSRRYNCEGKGERRDYADGYRINYKESQGRQQDDLVTQVSTEVWDEAVEAWEDHREHHIVIAGVPDPEDALAVHLQDIAAATKDTKKPGSVTFHHVMSGRGAAGCGQRDRRHEVAQRLAQKCEHLPAFQQKDVFLEKLRGCKVMVVVGPTGSGKSTVLPLVLKEDLAAGNAVRGKILVGQPRRLPTVGVCDHVRDLRCLNPLHAPAVRAAISYRIGQDNQTTPHSVLEFMTYGCIVNLLRASPKLEGYTHVFLDEIHERSLDMDLCLSLLIPVARHGGVKLILMSATFATAPIVTLLRRNGFSGTEVLADALAPAAPSGAAGAADVAGMMLATTTHRVATKYLRDVVELLGRAPCSAEDCSVEAVQRARVMNVRGRVQPLRTHESMLTLFTTPSERVSLRQCREYAADGTPPIE